MKENLQNLRLDVIEMAAGLHLLDQKMDLCNEKRKSYDRHTVMLNVLVNEFEVLLKKINTKEKQAKEAQTKLKSMKGVEELRNKHEELKKIIRPLENEHFKEFLEKFKYDNIEDYEKHACQVFPASNFNNRRKLHESSAELNQKVKEKLLAIQKVFEPEQAEERLAELEKTFKEIEQELTETKERNIKINEKLNQTYKLTLEKRAAFNELEKKVDTVQLEICDETINIQIALAESFHLLYLALVNCDKIPLSNGVLTGILDMPNEDDVDEHFHPIEKSLER